MAPLYVIKYMNIFILFHLYYFRHILTHKIAIVKKAKNLKSFQHYFKKDFSNFHMICKYLILN